MYRGGCKAPEFTSLEEWWGRHQADYYAAFGCLGSEWDETADVTEFVDAHVQAQTTQVEALSLRRATERLLWPALEDAVVVGAGLDARAANALYDALLGRDVTNRYYRGLTDVSVATAVNEPAPDWLQPACSGASVPGEAAGMWAAHTSGPSSRECRAGARNCRSARSAGGPA